MKKGILLIITAVIFFSCSDKQLFIVKDGKSDYSIVIPENADSLTLKAANELQKYIKTSTGALLPVTTVNDPEYVGKKILVGIKPEENIKTLPDEIWHVNKAKLLFIGGGNGKSTLYSVYSFLEKYAGVRFLTPEAEIVPENKDLIICKHLDYR